MFKKTIDDKTGFTHFEVEDNKGYMVSVVNFNNGTAYITLFKKAEPASSMSKNRIEVRPGVFPYWEVDRMIKFLEG